MNKTKTRKGPDESATKYKKGTKKRGNDGNMWIIVENKNGAHRWKRILEKSKIKKKSFLIHDNGGRPFKVNVTDKNIDIYTYDKELFSSWDDIPKKKDYNILIKSYKGVKQIFIPKGINNIGKAWSSGKGNTILVHISANRYLCIAEWIFEFETNGDKIQEFHSQVGNSDVPYPLAVGDKYIYFLISKGSEGYLSKDFFEDFPIKHKWAIDAYSRLWGQGPFVDFTKIKKYETKSDKRRRTYKKCDFKKMEAARKRASLTKEAKKIKKIKIIAKRDW